MALKRILWVRVILKKHPKCTRYQQNNQYKEILQSVRDNNATFALRKFMRETLATKLN